MEWTCILQKRSISQYSTTVLTYYSKLAFSHLIWLSHIIVNYKSDFGVFLFLYIQQENFEDPKSWPGFTVVDRCLALRTQYKKIPLILSPCVIFGDGQLVILKHVMHFSCFYHTHWYVGQIEIWQVLLTWLTCLWASDKERMGMDNTSI